jgi:gluconate 2-dehydrogenase alpha chain
MMVDLKKETWTWRPDPRSPALPMRQYGTFNPGKGLGGAAIHWSAQFYRYLESDFRHRSHIVERYGASKIPEGSTIQDWPIDYKDLEPYYDAFEWDIGVSGIPGNINGTILPGGNPFEAPRSRGYPNPPLAVPILAAKLAEASESLGLHPFTQAAGITSNAWTDPFGNHRGGCLYCGFCTRFGCEVDAKASPLNTHFPVALATNRYEIRANAKVLRVEVDGDGLATGVTYVDQQGNEHFQPADVVIVSAFTLENNRLLLLSKSKAHPNGIGNDRGRVGRNYAYQIYPPAVTGVWEGERLNQYMANTATMKILYDFNADNFDHSNLDFIGGSQLLSEGCERAPVTSVGKMKDPDGKTWGQGWKDTIRNDWDSTGSIVTQGEVQAYADNFLDLDPHYRDRWGNPLLRLTFDWHDNERNMWRYVAARAKEVMVAMKPTKIASFTPELPAYNIEKYQSTHPSGGCTMGSDPSDSVTNSYGQVWDSPNVFVTGAALWPQNPGANPTGTVGAVTYRAAEAIRDRYFKHPRQLLE